MTSIAPHIEAFLREYLVRHRGNSRHTCESYAYSFQALFEFASQRLKIPPSSMALEQLDAALICSFLEHLEIARGNSGNTRNIRLAAIRSFSRFLRHKERAGAARSVVFWRFPLRKQIAVWFHIWTRKKCRLCWTHPIPLRGMEYAIGLCYTLQSAPAFESRN